MQLSATGRGSGQFHRHDDANNRGTRVFDLDDAVGTKPAIKRIAKAQTLRLVAAQYDRFTEQLPNDGYDRTAKAVQWQAPTDIFNR